MKVKRKIVEIDQERCNGCGQCITSCAEGAIKLVDGKARLMSDQYCDGLGACLSECPQDALRIIEREADEFDEVAVGKHLQASAQHQPSTAGVHQTGCPSARERILSPEPGNRPERQTAGTGGEQKSALRHWPVQIRLVQPGASFLKNADLLVAADCTPVAYPNFHRDFLEGKTVMIGCPKFDDAACKEKFARIFQTAGIKSVTVVVMEVPCCQGLPVMVKEGMDLAGVHIPIEKVVVSADGDIIKRITIAS